MSKIEKKTVSAQIYDKGIQLGISINLIYAVVMHAVSKKYAMTTDFEMMLHICNHYKNLFENAFLLINILKHINEKVENSNNIIYKLEHCLSYIQTAIGIINYNSYCENNRENTIQLFKLANKCNNPVSQYYLGCCYIRNIDTSMQEEGSRLIKMAISNNDKNTEIAIRECFNYFELINNAVEYNDNRKIIFDAYISNIELKLSNEINNNHLLKKEANHILLETTRVANKTVAMAYNTFNNEFTFDATVLFDKDDLLT
jgi:hypothetical protein